MQKKMIFTTQLSPLPLLNAHTLPFTSSHCVSSHIFKSFKPSFSVLRTFSSLQTARPNKNPNRMPPGNHAKTSSSTPWLKKWPPPDPSHVPVDGDPDDANSRQPRNKFVESKGKTAIDRIVLRLRNLDLDSDDDEDEDEYDGEQKLGDLLNRDWIRPDAMLVEEKKKSDFGLLPWERVEEKEETEIRVERENGKKAKKSVKGATLAEMTIEESELKRLRGQGMVLRDKVNVPKAGLTQAVLEKIHNKWRKSELVRLKFHEDLAHDMKTAHILVERM